MAFLLNSTFGVFGQGIQDKYSKIKSELLGADSVFIISHEDTGGFIENSDGSASPVHPLILANRFNDSIIHEKLLLKRKSVKELCKILAIEKDRFREFSAGCFKPHHSIVIVDRGHYSCIEICFECGRVKAPEGFDFSEVDMGDRKWKKLIQFFKRSHFKYELERYKW